jgi:hypothetical protein
MKRTLAIAALLIVAGVVQSNATLLIRELWDNIPAGNLKDKTNGTTSVGFNPIAKWTVNPADPAATNALTISLYDIYDDYLKVYPNLPASATAAGTLNLPQPNPNGWDSGAWAIRLLAITNQIAGTNKIIMTNNAVYYFSARMLKRSFYYPVNGTNGYGTDDAALGFGLASGNTTNAHFVGIGLTRSVAGNISGGGGYKIGSTDIGDSVYISAGTLGQTGYVAHPTDSVGPYYVRAYSGDGSGYGGIQEVEGYLNGADYETGAWVMGRLTTTTSGSSTMDVRAYVATEVPETDPAAVFWDATYTFNETNNMIALLVWMYGNNNANPCALDGIRVATTWAEVVGEEIIGPPAANPTNVIYAGTPVTFSVLANIASTSSSFQWLTNGVPDANNGLSATYTLTNPVTANSGNYSVVFSNEWGLAITSAVQTLTVLPSVPPYVVTQPGGATHYAGGSITFTVVVNGAPPFSYQWSHVSGGVTNVVYGPTAPATAFTNSFTLPNVQAADAGDYFATISNAQGATNSQPATFNVVVPTGFAAAVMANNPYAYWPMSETNGTVIHDFFGGHDGTVLDTAYTVTNIVATTNNSVITYATNTSAAGVNLGAAGAVCAGFPANHLAVTIPNNGLLARLNMPALPVYTNVMTFCGWVYTPGANAAGLILNRDLNSSGGYGNCYGLEFVPHSTPTTTNYNTLGYQWGGYDLNPNAANLGYTWTNSGLYVPNANWTFVALVFSNTQATIYMGTNNAPLTVASHTFPSTTDASFPGVPGSAYSSYTNSYPLLIGRSGYPWAEPGQSNAWNGANVTMSDVAIFYSALPPTNVYKLYLAAVGELITTTNASGDLVLSWPIGTLQAAGQVTGVYTNVPGAISPYTVPFNVPQKFYRVLSQ